MTAWLMEANRPRPAHQALRARTALQCSNRPSHKPSEPLSAKTQLEIGRKEMSQKLADIVGMRATGTAMRSSLQTSMTLSILTCPKSTERNRHPEAMASPRNQSRRMHHSLKVEMMTVNSTTQTSQAQEDVESRSRQLLPVTRGSMIHLMTFGAERGHRPTFSQAEHRKNSQNRQSNPLTPLVHHK